MKKLLLLLLAAMSLAAQTYTFSDGRSGTRLEFAANEAYVTVGGTQNRVEALARVKSALGAELKSAMESGGSGFVVEFATTARKALGIQGGKLRLEPFRTAAPVCSMPRKCGVRLRGDLAPAGCW